jgi:hypothetical protein
MLKISTITTIDEVIEMLRRLSSVAMQVVDDVESAGKTGDLYLLYDRMVANSADIKAALTSPQQVAQDTLQGERHD